MIVGISLVFILYLNDLTEPILIGWVLLALYQILPPFLGSDNPTRDRVLHIFLDSGWIHPQQGNLRA